MTEKKNGKIIPEIVATNVVASRLRLPSAGPTGKPTACAKMLLSLATDFEPGNDSRYSTF